MKLWVLRHLGNSSSRSLTSFLLKLVAPSGSSCVDLQLCQYFFYFLPDLTVLLGLFRDLEIFLYPSPALCFSITFSRSGLECSFYLHGLCSATIMEKVHQKLTLAARGFLYYQLETCDYTHDHITDNVGLSLKIIMHLKSIILTFF